MEGFKNFVQTMDRASDICSQWTSAENGWVYSYAELMLLAAYLDRDYPLDERQWYIVFPDGEICMLHEDFDEIMPLWRPVKSNPVRQKLTGDEFYPDDQPVQQAQAPVPRAQFKFCMHCGAKLPVNAAFCNKCGQRAVDIK
ncbi:MAG: zinc ribbon domain-containing protein [Oscillospiraceae bacterium]|nr:zinc ribbon domain-containing protein [Oscillospiraceae bacterium]